MNGINVEHTARDFWATRPRRRADDRKVGGVAAAIGRRYGIDPVLVRVAFVVVTLISGVGVLLYLLGWLLLPAEGDEVSAAESLLGRGRSSMSPVLTLVLGVLLIPASGAVLGRGVSGLFGLVLAGAAMVLLHRSRSALGEVPVSANGDPVRPAAQDVPGTTTTTDRPTPPAWDPLGAAPFAWDLPEPSPAPAPADPLPWSARSKVTPITLGLALLAGGIASAFWPALPVGHLVALVLGVVGLGLVVGSLVHSGRGLIAVAVPLALLTMVLQAAPVSGFNVGTQRWSPVTAADVQPRYEVTLGNAHLDLTGLTFPEGHPVVTGVAVGVGQTHVIVPPNVDVQVSCQAQLGEVHCLGVAGEGSPARANATDNGPDGPGGGKLVLNVRSGAGNIHVERES
ncbi:MAG TPA: PspC domain-containing protein [Pseudonocardiaceae bacterium]